MRILQLLEATLGGVGRHVIDLTEGLLDRGHEVHVAYSDLRSDQVFADDVRRIRAHPDLRFLPLAMRREPSASDAFAIWKFRQYLRREGPFDLVHCHSTKAGIVGRLGAAGLSSKRIYTAHGFFTMDRSHSPLARRTIGSLEAMLARFGDGVIVVSREEYAHALALGIPASQLSLIPNGAAAHGSGAPVGDRPAVRRDLGIGAEEFLIGFVGRLVPVKSPATMLEAFAAFRGRSQVPAKLAMVGDGPLAEDLRRQAAKLGLQRDIVWVGTRNARPLMCAFDVLCLTSHSEGTPLVALEALVQGLPIVATEVGHIPEIVRPGENGFIVPLRGVTEIAAALDILSRDAALRDRMGRASHNLSPNFSIEKMIEHTISFYRQVAFGPGRVVATPDLKITASH
jgi:glycosyltransferase involved in cell wall biosynthesis